MKRLERVSVYSLVLQVVPSVGVEDLCIGTPDLGIEIDYGGAKLDDGSLWQNDTSNFNIPCSFAGNISDWVQQLARLSEVQIKHLNIPGQ